MIGERERDVALLIVAALVAYATASANGFAYDDVGIVVRNPTVTGPGSMRDVWLSPYWPNQGEMLGLYRPVTIAALALQWQLANGAPALFHAVSVALHAGCVLLLHGVLLRLASRPAALFGALLFAVHPVHTEAVANVVGQAELLAAAAALGAALLWLARPPGRATGHVLGVAALYAIAVLAKESAIVVPLLLLALDIATGRHRDGVAAYVRSIAPAIAAAFVVALGALALRAAVLGSLLGTAVGASLPFLHGPGRIWAALRVWPEYARLLFLPLDLSSDYSPAVILPPAGPEPMVVLGAVLLAAVVAGSLATAARPRVGLPCAWFLITILPVSNLLFPIGVVLAERTLYLPSAALSIAAAHLFDASAAFDGRARRLLAAGAVVVLVAFTARTALRNPVWRDSASVARTLYAEHPESFRAQWEVAKLSMLDGDTAAAHDHFLLAYRIWPESAALATDYGSFLTRTGRAAVAVGLLERARRQSPASITTAVALADAQLHAGRPRAALETLNAVERMAPGREDVARLRARARALCSGDARGCE